MKSVYEKIMKTIFFHNEIPNAVIIDVFKRTNDWTESNGFEDCDYLERQLCYLNKFISE